MSTAHTTGINLPCTEEERTNIELCKEYMRIAYDPKEASADNVALLCADDSVFIGQSTFPCHDVPGYAETHAVVMKSINDLQIIQYDVIIAKKNMVMMRYTASGAHNGEPWHGIPATGKRANWHACVIFELENGKIKKMYKEWDKALMWKQFGFPVEEYTDVKADLEVTKQHIQSH